jgi:hypothetical protein
MERPVVVQNVIIARFVGVRDPQTVVRIIENVGPQNNNWTWGNWGGNNTKGGTGGHTDGRSGGRR